MGSVEEKLKPGCLVSGTDNLCEGMKLLKELQDQNGIRKPIHSELWHACAGPLVTLPQIGSLVYYLPQGHSEQIWYGIVICHAAKVLLRNVLDMNARLGGFNAALLETGKSVWVMNVVPTTGSNSPPLIVDRGFIGVQHDWCEPFPTYPRTYDLVHAEGLISLPFAKHPTCEALDLFAEMDRLLRPEVARLEDAMSQVYPKLQEIKVSAQSDSRHQVSLLVQPMHQGAEVVRMYKTLLSSSGFRNVKKLFTIVLVCR